MNSDDKKNLGKNSGQPNIPTPTAASSSAASTGQKPQLTAEQIKALMEMMQKQKPLPKYRQYMQQAMAILVKFTQDTIVHLENFVQYVVGGAEIDKKNVMNTARGPIVFGLYVIAIFVVLGGGWAAIAPLDSASHAQGTVIPSSKRKLIQSIHTGVVKEIYVTLGQEVKEGDKIIEFDETRARAEYITSLNEYQTLLSAESRLIAERDELPEIKFDKFLEDRKDVSEVAILMRTESQLFKSRTEARKKAKEGTDQARIGCQKDLERAIATRASHAKNRSATKEILDSHKELYEKGHLKRSDLLTTEVRHIDSNSQLAAIDSEIAKQKERLIELDANILSKESEYLAQILRELNNVQQQKNASYAKYVATKDMLEKIVVTSPVDGTVIEVYANAVGQVIGGGNPIAEILPTNDALIVEAKIRPIDIASVEVGLKAKIKFTAYKSRTTPVFEGTVVSLSPDTIMDQRMGPLYTARIEIDMDDFNRQAKKGKLILRPGMEVDVNIVTGTRTLLRYLIDPITDSMFKAFKEK